MCNYSCMLLVFTGYLHLLGVGKLQLHYTTQNLLLLQQCFNGHTPRSTHNYASTHTLLTHYTNPITRHRNTWRVFEISQHKKRCSALINPRFEVFHGRLGEEELWFALDVASRPQSAMNGADVSSIFAVESVWWEVDQGIVNEYFIFYSMLMSLLCLTLRLAYILCVRRYSSGFPVVLWKYTSGISPECTWQRRKLLGNFTSTTYISDTFILCICWEPSAVIRMLSQ